MKYKTHYNKEPEKDRRVLYFFITAIVLIGLAVLGFVTGVFAPDISQSTLIADKDFYDFEEIDILGGKVSTSYELTNSGSEPLKITFIKTNCMCTEAVIEGKIFSMHEPNSTSIEFQSGETKILKAIFDPMAHGPDATGPITREITLRTNSEKTKELTLRFTGNVIKNE